VDQRELLATRDLTDRSASRDRSDGQAVVAATDCAELQVIRVSQAAGGAGGHGTGAAAVVPVFRLTVQRSDNVYHAE